MNLFGKKQINPNNPSKILLDKILAELEKAGIQDERKRMECAKTVLKTTVTNFRSMLKLVKGGSDASGIIVEWGQALKKLLADYGVQPEEKQEDTVIALLDILQETGMGAN